MLSVLGWGAAALALLLGLAIAVLATPVRLALSLRTAPRWRLRIAARLLGGLTPAITLHDSARPRKVARPKKKTARKHARADRQTAARALRGLSAAPELAGGLLRRIHLRRLAVDADLGLGDPADTGQLFGLVQALRHALPDSETISVAIRPDFTEARAAGAVDAELSVTPLAFLAPGLRFASRIYGWRLFGGRR